MESKRRPIVRVTPILCASVADVLKGHGLETPERRAQIVEEWRTKKQYKGEPFSLIEADFNRESTRIEKKWLTRARRAAFAKFTHQLQPKTRHLAGLAGMTDWHLVDRGALKLHTSMTNAERDAAYARWRDWLHKELPRLQQQFMSRWAVDAYRCIAFRRSITRRARQLVSRP